MFWIGNSDFDKPLFRLSRPNLDCSRRRIPENNVDRIVIG